MSSSNKLNTDVLRVTEYVLNRSTSRDTFSVSEAARAQELNGINEYRIAEILREICLQPNGPNSIEQLTTVDGNYSHSNSGKWELNSQAYFSYLSYLSLKRSDESLVISKESQNTAIISKWVAITALGISAIQGTISLITTMFWKGG